MYPVIDDIATRTQAYCGILGIDLFVDGEKYNVIEFNPFFKQMHLQTILPLINADLYDLFLSAASGSLSDEYEYVKMYNQSSVSKIIKKPQDINVEEIEDVNIAYTNNSNIILTKIAKTTKRAKEELNEIIEILS